MRAKKTKHLLSCHVYCLWIPDKVCVPVQRDPAHVHLLVKESFVSLLGRHTATRVCGKLAGASSVVLQALQDALGQNFDVSVRLWVCVNKLQLLQAALLQEHAAVTSGVLAADVLHGPGCPQLDTGGMKALQQGKEGVK